MHTFLLVHHSDDIELTIEQWKDVMERANISANNVAYGLCDNFDIMLQQLLHLRRDRSYAVLIGSALVRRSRQWHTRGACFAPFQNKRNVHALEKYPSQPG